MNPSIKVFAPATVSNLSAGFDIIGLAVHEPGDEVTITLNNSGKVRLVKIIGDQGKLPIDPLKNTVSAVVIQYLKQRELPYGADIVLHKKMPFGSGLGSSSASAVAGLVAINELMPKPWKRIDLLPLAMEGERLACGNAHADNVAPALLGGVTLIRQYEPLDIINLPFPTDLHFGLVYPYVNVPTGLARQIIKPKIALADAVKQWGNLGGLVAGFCTKDAALIGRSAQDIIIEPTRSLLIPFFHTLKEMALKNGGLGFGISGSGPTVFSLTDSAEKASAINQILQDFLTKQMVKSEGYVSNINTEGAKIIS